MASIRRRLRGAADESGAELIELAVVFPILLLLIAGMVDFGFLLQRFEVVTNAAREGARMATLTAAYSEDDIGARVGDYLRASGLSETPVVTVTCPIQTLPNGVVVANTDVTVEYPSRFSFIGPIAAMFGGSGWGTMTLRAASTMRSEGGFLPCP